jgi:hypothetical protein
MGTLVCLNCLNYVGSVTVGSDHGIFLEKLTSWFGIYGYDDMVTYSRVA